MSSGFDPVNVFFSYSHADEDLRNELEDHLAPLKRDQTLSTWHDRKIGAGEGWSGQIDRHLEIADVVLLLVSSKFLASDFCRYETERALARHRAGDATVIPIILKACNWKSELGDLQALPRDDQAVTSWSNRDEALLHVAQGIEEAVRRGAHLKAEPPRPKQIFLVPDLRSPFFTGRENVLEELRKILVAEGREGLGQTAAISGLGGIGKTQTALEYAERHRDDYRAVFFTRADSETELLTGFAAIAKALGLPLARDNDLTLIRDAVVHWLEINDGWLLILDNADEPEQVKSFLSRRHCGHVLVTSRESKFDVLGIRCPLQMAAFPPPESARFLLKRTGRENASQQEKEAAAGLAEELGHLALALEQAGAYVAEMEVRFGDYLESYRRRGLELLEQGHLVGDDSRTVATTWSLNFEKVAEESAASADLLRACAFLAPQDIPEEILTEGAGELGSELSETLLDRDPISIGRLLRPLRRYSLIERDIEGRTFSAHRLVQKVMRESLDDKSQRLWAERVINALSRLLPEEIEFSVWPLCERVVPHARIIQHRIVEYSLETASAGRVLNQMGRYLFGRAQFVEARTIIKQALFIREKVFGIEHLDVASSLNDMAITLQELDGRYADAELLFERSLRIRENALGKDHLDISVSLNNMAALYHLQGRYAASELLYERSLRIRENALGAENSQVAKSLYNLACLFKDQGRYAEAESLYERSLRLQQMVLSDEDPEVAFSLTGLACLYQALDRHAAAEPLFKRALDILEKALGATHPRFAGNLNSLANLYRDQQRYADAELLYKRAIDLMEKAFGLNHPYVAAPLHNLAALYQTRRLFAEAELLFRRALDILEMRLGAEHPNVSTLLRSLGILYRDQKRPDKAEPLLRRSVRIREKKLGDHPDTAAALESHASVLRLTGRLQEATKVQARAKAMRKRIATRERRAVAEAQTKGPK